MKKGCLIFAHNNRQIDYSLLALISGGLAKKNLKANEDAWVVMS